MKSLGSSKARNDEGTEPLVEETLQVHYISETDHDRICHGCLPKVLPLKPKFLLLFPLSFVLWACDISERPLTDPAEMVERAVVLYNEQSFAQAEPLFEKALHLFEQQPNPPLRLKALTYLSSIGLEQKEFRISMERAETAAVLSKTLGDFRGQAELAILRGDILFALREYNRAAESYQEGMTLAASFADERSSAEAERKLAASMNANGQSNEALDHARNAVTMFQKIQEKNKIGEALSTLGEAYRLEKRYPEALNSLKQASGSIDRSTDPLLMSRVYLDLGVTQLALGNPNGALTNFRDAANTARRAKAGKALEVLSLYRIGSVYYQSARIGDAKKYYTDAMEVARAVGDLIAENYLYVMIVDCNLRLMTPDQRLRTAEKLEQSYQQIARRFADCGHRTGEAYMDVELGKLWEQRGDLQRASEYFRKAVDLDLSIIGEYCDAQLHRPYQQALGIDGGHAEWYYLLAGTEVKLQHSSKALLALESSRIKHVFQNMENIDLAFRHPRWKKPMVEARGRINRGEILEVELSAALARASHAEEEDRIRRLRSELNGLKVEIEKVSKTIVSDYPNYGALVSETSADITGIQNFIPRGSLLLEYLPLPDRLIIFAIGRSRFEIRTAQIGRDSLLASMAAYRSLLQEPTVYAGESGSLALPAMEKFAALSPQLYDWFFRPVDDLLDRNLVIVMNEEFGMFPFHTLERQDRNGNVKYLIELAGVDYVSTLSSLKYKTVSTSHIRDVVAFGNPTGKNWSIDYELRDIRSFFKGATVYIGLETSWDNVRSAVGDVLQLSTEFSDGAGSSPLGEIKLSNGLTVEESSSVPFEKLAELESIPVIVLSNQYGQGVGLSGDHATLLRVNGTSDVFLNAWFADRKASKFFSEYFFTSLANGLAPGDAYRQALLNMIRMREVAHPRSWGQFFHFGVG